MCERFNPSNKGLLLIKSAMSFAASSQIALLLKLKNFKEPMAFKTLIITVVLTVFKLALEMSKYSSVVAFVKADMINSTPLLEVMHYKSNASLLL